ncbi:hypothetical protein BM1_07480 [Bipolaris maydis]|nr:hypothetical protein BM1_07480 [Bipolaris maydis]
MGHYHIIPAGEFFSFSPEIRIRKNPAIEDIVSEARKWIKEHPEKGGKINCQKYPTSDKERYGHLVRLIGVNKMHAMLRELKDKTGRCDLIYFKMIANIVKN